MALFTLVLDYRGGICVRQTTGRKAKTALIKGIAEFDIFTARSRRKFTQAVLNDPLVPVEGMKGVWCASALITGDPALIHIVATASVVFSVPCVLCG